MSDNKYFLTKSGQNYGPFEKPEIDAMKKDGRILEYSHIWLPNEQRWESTAPTPMAPPMMGAALPPEARTETRPAAAEPPAPKTRSERRSAGEIKIPAVEVVCYDHETMVPGELAHVTEMGCEFISTTPSQSPTFASQGAIFLNVLLPKTGKTMSVRARLSGVTRAAGRWRYQLQWKECPEILR